jgi:hypothetical protein
MKKVEREGAYNMNGENTYAQILAGRQQENISLQTPRCRWHDNNKIDLKEKWYKVN